MDELLLYKKNDNSSKNKNEIYIFILNDFLT